MRAPIGDFDDAPPAAELPRPAHRARSPTPYAHWQRQRPRRPARSTSTPTRRWPTPPSSSSTYGPDLLEPSANCVVVAGKRGGERTLAACVVLSTTRVDVNGVVRRQLGARKASFAPMDTAVGETGMEYGGITPIGLPAGWPLLVDAAVVDLPVRADRQRQPPGQAASCPARRSPSCRAPWCWRGWAAAPDADRSGLLLPGGRRQAAGGRRQAGRMPGQCVNRQARGARPRPVARSASARARWSARRSPGRGRAPRRPAWCAGRPG